MEKRLWGWEEVRLNDVKSQMQPVVERGISSAVVYVHREYYGADPVHAVG